MAGYRAVVEGHGIVAAITFLLVVPAAIFIARFYHRKPDLALRFHIWLQILTVLLSTVVFILGFQAVGIARSLTNPHHGIGVAMYVLILVQAFGGCLIHRWEKFKRPWRVPLKLMVRRPPEGSVLTVQLHQWIGRAIGLLGVVQVALGLTLYGSPLALFVLYALWLFFLVALYFVLCYRTQPDTGFDDGETYISDHTRTSGRTGTTHSHRTRRLGALAAGTAAGAALARHRSRSQRSHSRADVVSSRHSSRHAESYISDEKYRDEGRRPWKERILGAATAAGGIMALRSLFNRRRDADEGSDASYSHTEGTSRVSQSDISRVEEGRAPASPANERWRRVEEREAAQQAAMTGSPLRQARRPGRRHSRSRSSGDSYDSRPSVSDVRRHESHGLRDGIAALGVAGFLKSKWNKRRDRKETEREEELRRHDMEEERIARMKSSRRKYTGDGMAPPRRGGRTAPSTVEDESDISGTSPALSRHARPMDSRANVSQAEPMTPPGPSHLPPPPFRGIDSESGSEGYTSSGGGHHRRHRAAHDAAVAAAAAPAVPGTSAQRENSRQRSDRDGSVGSPPVSVKVKVHNAGRHVTLRRLNEEEAAAEREARYRREQSDNGHPAAGSAGNVGDDHWRRVEAREAAQAAQQASPAPPIPMPEPAVPRPASYSGGSMAMQSHSPLPPPPPPVPGTVASGMSSPPGTSNLYTETDGSNYGNNRRRRRAERVRAQPQQSRLGSGSRVEFS